MDNERIKINNKADISAIHNAVVIFGENGQRFVMTPELAAVIAKELPLFVKLSRHLAHTDAADLSADPLPSGLTILPARKQTPIAILQ